MPDHKTPVRENQLAKIVERISALSPAYLSDYVVPRLPAWQARATLTFAVMAAAQRAALGHADWPTTDVRRLARALRDHAPGTYAALVAPFLELEKNGSLA